MGGSPSKQPRPSYEDGQFRDPSIEAMQQAAANEGQDQKDKLTNLIKRSVQKPAPEQ